MRRGAAARLGAAHRALLPPPSEGESDDSYAVGSEDEAASTTGSDEEEVRPLSTRSAAQRSAARAAAHRPLCRRSALAADDACRRELPRRRPRRSRRCAPLAQAARAVSTQLSRAATTTRRLRSPSLRGDRDARLHRRRRRPPSPASMMRCACERTPCPERCALTSLRRRSAPGSGDTPRACDAPTPRTTNIADTSRACGWSARRTTTTRAGCQTLSCLAPSRTQKRRKRRRRLTKKRRPLPSQRRRLTAGEHAQAR